MGGRHKNSSLAHRRHLERFSDRQRLVYELLLLRGRMTDREVKVALGYLDMNSVRPRITELIKMGWAVEVGQKICPVTHTRVRVVCAVSRAERRIQDQGQMNLL